MNKFCAVFFFSVVCFLDSVGQKMTPDQYVAQYRELAIREMKRMGVPAAITLAQGILETEGGNSALLQKSNNHFGIKCKSSWTGESVSHDDDTVGECFRVYKDAEDSYRDHSNFLRGNDRYSFLFKLDPTDYKGWAYGLRKAGYATNPRYPEILIKHIETYNLEQYTVAAASEVPVFDASKYTSDPETKGLEAPDNVALLSTSDNSATSTLSINNCKAVFAPKGTSLLAIATKNNINLSRLLQMNELKNDGLLEKDQFVFLEKKRTEGNRDFCVVEPDETLYDVAQKNGILLQSLCDYNHLSINESIVVGTKLFLKAPSQGDFNQYNQNVQAVASQRKLPEDNIRIQTYEVQPKEGLYSISKRYGVTVSQIKDWNNLSDDNLKVGQVLIISK